MKKKTILFFILGLLLVGILSNSCKKENQGTISSILTAAPWQLATVTVTTNDKLIATTDTLNKTCTSTQILTFNTDNTCSYTNFDCITQQVNGKWSLSVDQLILTSNITCTVNSTGSTSQPFLNTQVYNAGQYSLVLQTGDYNVIPTTTNKTIVVRYGFVRQKAAIK